MSRIRVIGSMHPVPINCPWPDVRQISMPDLVCAFRQLDSAELTFSLVIENAEFHLTGVCGKYCKVCTFSIPGCAARIWQSFFQDCLLNLRHYRSAPSEEQKISK